MVLCPERCFSVTLLWQDNIVAVSLQDVAFRHRFIAAFRPYIIRLRRVSEGTFKITPHW